MRAAKEATKIKASDTDSALIANDKKIFLQFFSKRTRKLSIKSSILSMKNKVTRLRKRIHKKSMKANKKN
jgi:hypothetical protein